MSAAPVDYAALAKQAGATDSQLAPAQSGVVDYAALAKQAGATDSQPAPSATNGQAASADPTFTQRVMDPNKTYDNLSGGSGPLNNATQAGVATVAQGLGQAVKGVYDAAKPPEDSHEKAVVATLGPAGLLAFRMGKGLVSSAKSAADVPGAIKDINASPDPAGTYATVAGKTAGQAAGQATAAALTPVAANVAGKAIGAVSSLRGIPEAISSDTISALNNVAAKEGLPVSTATTARDAAADLSQNFIKRAKATYKPVDDAVGGDLKPVQEKIGQLESAIEKNLNVDPDKAAKFTEDLGKQRETLKGLVERAKQNGVPNAEDIMKAGDKDYSRGMAMKEVQKGVATASGQVKMNGHPNPGGFASQIDMFERKGILQRALGQDGTDALIQNAKIGLARGKTLTNVKGAAVGTAKYAGIPAGAAVGYGVFKALSGK